MCLGRRFVEYILERVRCPFLLHPDLSPVILNLTLFCVCFFPLLFCI